MTFRTLHMRFIYFDFRPAIPTCTTHSFIPRLPLPTNGRYTGTCIFESREAYTYQLLLIQPSNAYSMIHNQGTSSLGANSAWPVLPGLASFFFFFFFFFGGGGGGSFSTFQQFFNKYEYPFQTLHRDNIPQGHCANQQHPILLTAIITYKSGLFRAIED